VLLVTPTDVTVPPLEHALPDAKHTAPVPDTPLLRFEAASATPPTSKPVVALMRVPVIPTKVLFDAVKTFEAFNRARFAESERFVEASAAPFTIKPPVAFHTGAVWTVPVNVFERFNLARFEPSDRAEELICTPFIS
jgi:hypothetical protein